LQTFCESSQLPFSVDVMLELELPFPPSVNQYWRAIPLRGKGGKTVGARNIISEDGREYRERVVRQLKPLSLPTLAGRLSLVIEFREPKPARARDLDNFNKALWDALTHAGVWQDDSQIDQYTVCRGEPGEGIVLITIQEISK
jgi:crossover junction endodeoxyribonuclease RusA